MAKKNDNPDDARLGGKRSRPKLPSVSEKKKSNAGTKAFNLFILVFIIYGFYSYMQKGGDVGIFNDLGHHLEVIEAPREGDPRIDRLQNQRRMSAMDNLMPVESINVTHRTLKEGEGVPASCGQTVTYRLVSGVGSEQEMSEVKSFRLGDYQKPHGLTLGVEGMRVGEVREIVIPQQLWTGDVPAEGQRAQRTIITVELKSISPQEPQTDMALRRFVTRNGSGIPLRCGDLAVLHMAVWAENGKKLFATEQGKPLYFYIGENSVPYALERGVQGMLPGGQYSLIFAPELWKRLTENVTPTSAPAAYEVQPFPTDIEWPSDQLILVDIAYPKQVAQKGLPAMPIADNSPPEAKPELETPLSEPSEVEEPELETPVKE